MNLTSQSSCSAAPHKPKESRKLKNRVLRDRCYLIREIIQGLEFAQALWSCSSFRGARRLASPHYADNTPPFTTSGCTLQRMRVHTRNARNIRRSRTFRSFHSGWGKRGAGTHVGCIRARFQVVEYIRRKEALPNEVDLRPYCSPVEYQDTTNS